MSNTAKVPKRSEHRTNLAKWEEMFSRLRAFKEQHGHCLVPNRYAEDRSLGSWVSTQRRHYKIMMSGNDESIPMTQQRVRSLESLGFKWETTDPRHVPWETRFQELVEYKEKFGSCLVPVGYKANPPLSNWVSTQRQEYKLLCEGRTSKLTPERVDALQRIGFVWQAQKGGSRKRNQAVLQNAAVPEVTASFPHQRRHFNVPETIQSLNPTSPSTARGAFQYCDEGRTIVDRNASATRHRQSSLQPQHPANNNLVLSTFTVQNIPVLTRAAVVDLETAQQLQQQQLLQELFIRRENEARLLGECYLLPTAQDQFTSLSAPYGHNRPLAVLDPLLVNSTVVGGVQASLPVSLPFHPRADRVSQLPFATGTPRNNSVTIAASGTKVAAETPALPVVDVPPNIKSNTKARPSDQESAKCEPSLTAFHEKSSPQNRDLAAKMDTASLSSSSELYRSVRPNGSAPVDVDRLPASASRASALSHYSNISRERHYKGAGLLGKDPSSKSTGARLGQDQEEGDDDIFADAD